MAEFMLQRRLYKDDARGVGEALNEHKDDDKKAGIPLTTRHWWRLLPPNADTKSDRVFRKERYFEPLSFFHTQDTAPKAPSTLTPLPDHIELILHPVSSGKLFARFHNVLDSNFDDPVTTTIDALKFFSQFGEVDSIEPVSLNGVYTEDDI